MAPGLTVSDGFIQIERQLGELELRQLAEHRDAKVVSLHHLALESLAFLESLASLEDLRLYAVRAADYGALSRIKTLRKLFISGPKESALSYLSNVTQVEELSILWARQLTVLPDLSRCHKLTQVLLLSCKRLTDIGALSATPNLKAVRTVELGLKEPGDYETLIASPQLSYVAVQLSGVKRNTEIARLLAKHGKAKHAPSAAPADVRADDLLTER